MKQVFFAVAGLLVGLVAVQAQEGYTRVNGQYFPYTVSECGDTLILASLNDVSVSSLRKFDSDEEYKRYRRYRLYAIKVYPYAQAAIRIFRETEYVTENMRDGQRRRYIRKLQKELKDEFGEPLKHLSKTQGKILFKMIERETEKPLYFLIKDLRGGLTATYWSTLGSLYGHKLRDGYVRGEDKILDAVLDDFELAYQVPQVDPKELQRVPVKEKKKKRRKGEEVASEGGE